MGCDQLPLSELLVNAKLGYCRKCKSKVLHYTANQPLIDVRPTAVKWDYWCACSNKNCVNSYGNGYYLDEFYDFSWFKPF